jgi:hypothetical protein
MILAISLAIYTKKGAIGLGITIEGAAVECPDPEEGTPHCENVPTDRRCPQQLQYVSILQDPLQHHQMLWQEELQLGRHLLRQ